MPLSRRGRDARDTIADDMTSIATSVGNPTHDDLRLDIRMLKVDVERQGKQLEAIQKQLHEILARMETTAS